MKNQLKVYKRLATGSSDNKPLTLKSLKPFWFKVKKSIEIRLSEFKEILSKGSENVIFAELVFCLFTPQSKAIACGEAVKRLTEKGLIGCGTAMEIAKEINIVRFRNNKAKYLVEARGKFIKNGKFKIREKLNSFSDVYKLRLWLVNNIKGMAFKEASHFLRNIGLGSELAILDRHILRNLNRLGVIKNIPETINGKTYIKIEKKMKSFAKKVLIPLAHLDLLFWCKETGEIYK